MAQIETSDTLILRMRDLNDEAVWRDFFRIYKPESYSAVVETPEYAAFVEAAREDCLSYQASRR